MRNPKIRILLMIDEASMGGGQQHLLWLARGLNRKLFDVAVACAPAGYLVDQLSRSEIPVFPMIMKNRLSLRSVLECRRILKSFRPDIVHTHGGTAGFTGRIASKLAGVQGTVHTYHGIHYLHYRDWVRRTAFRAADFLLKRWTSRLICVSKSDFDAGCKAGIVDPVKAVVIRNGIDVGEFSRRITGKRKRERVIGTIGRLHIQKGHRWLIEALPAVRRQIPGAVIEIVGDGELRAELEQQAGSLGAGAQVRFLGERTDIPALLAGMEIFVLPSLWEGLPLVLLEAMAASRPIVATGVDGVLEVVEDGKDALLVPPGDATALAEAIILVLKKPALARQLASRARKKVCREFDIQSMISEIAGVYRAVFREGTSE